MKSQPNSRSTVVKGNIFHALGFSKAEAAALEIKADILSAILDRIRSKKYTQSQLVKILDEHQPSVSNLMRGRIDQVSIEKLLRYANRLSLKTSVSVRPIRIRPIRKRGPESAPQTSRPRRPKLARAS
jgi:predicted XRE-type DNA-binding protein